MSIHWEVKARRPNNSCRKVYIPSQENDLEGVVLWCVLGHFMHCLFSSYIMQSTDLTGLTKPHLFLQLNYWSGPIRVWPFYAKY